MHKLPLLLLVLGAPALASCSSTTVPDDDSSNGDGDGDSGDGDGYSGDGDSGDGDSGDGDSGDGDSGDGDSGDGDSGDADSGDADSGDGDTGDGDTGDGDTGDGDTGDGDTGDGDTGDGDTGDGDGNPGGAYDCDFGAPVITSLAPSTSPPGGLAVDNVPQFISIGFDDNRYEDGMEWALNLFDGLKNPEGKGEKCTFDNSIARVSFFITSNVEGSSEQLKDLFYQAYTDGHEVGNHTNTHGEILQKNADKAVWQNELSTCNDLLTSLGVPRSAITGFRTPFLAWSEATFQVQVEEDFGYDCSIEHYYGDGGFQWPFTLDHAPNRAYVAPTGNYPGLWELPVSELMMATTGWQAVTGFDYNMWVSKSMSKQTFLDVMKANLDLRMKGGNGYEPNRAPLFLGAHTDYYSDANSTFNAAASGSSVAERRAAIEEFVEYALAYHPDVRIVPHAEIVRWMKAPVGLDGTRGK